MSPAVCAFACAIAATVATAAETPRDYAYRVPLAGVGDSAFVRVDIPDAVYEGAARADLGDLRVFNGDGAAVAYAFLPLPSPAREAAGSASLPLFPLRVDAARADLSDVAITVRKESQLTTIDLATRNGQPVVGQRLAGYLVDASGVRQPITALTLAFASADDVTTRVRVDASDDLASWRPLVPDTPVVDVHFAGRRLVRDRVEFARSTAKYLRVAWVAGQPGPELASATVEFGERVVDAPRRWRTVAPVASVKPGEYEFDLGGDFPVDRVTLELPELNSVAPAQLVVRASSSEQWRPVASGVFYRLREGGGEIANAPIAPYAPPGRHWRVRIDPNAGAIAGDVRLTAGWRPHVIVFAARGRTPFELAYGSKVATPVALPIATLMPGYGSGVFDASTLPVATPGAVATSNAKALREPLDVKRWALWSALVLAAAVLGAMAWRLVRQMGAPSKPSQSPSDEGGR